jgi:protein YibB
MKEDITIVTSFLDIGRSSWSPRFKRSNDFYFNSFKNMTNTSNNIIVFTEKRFFDTLLSIREDILTVPIDGILDEYYYLIERISKVQRRKTFIDFVLDKKLPEYTDANYVFINYMKSFFVKTALDKGLVKTNVSAWIDFGYARKKEFCPEGSSLILDTKGKITIFSMEDNINFSYEQIKTFIKTGEVKIQGCHIISPNNLWHWLFERISHNLNKLLCDDLIDDDQTLLLMSYNDDPSKFNVLRGSNDNWFNLFVKEYE